MFDLVLAALLLLVELLPSFTKNVPRLRATMHALSVGLIVLVISVVILLFAFGVLVTVGRLLVARVRLPTHEHVLTLSAAHCVHGRVEPIDRHKPKALLLG